MMFCPNCGSPLNEDGSCPACGPQKPEAEASPDMAEPTPATQTEPTPAAMQTESIPAMQTDPLQQPEQPGYAQPVMPAPKKKMSKGAKIGISVAAIVCVLALGVFLFLSPLMRLIMGEARYYAVKESKNATQSVLQLEDAAKKEAARTFGRETTVSVSGDSMLSMFSDLKIAISAQQDGATKKGYESLKLSDGDYEIGSIALLSDDGKVAVQLMDDALYSLTDEKNADSGNASLCEKCTGMTEAELTAFAASYMETALTAIPKDKIEVKRSLSGDTVTFIIDEKTIRAIGETLSERVRDDDKLRDIAHKLYAFLKENKELFTASTEFDDTLTDEDINKKIEEFADGLQEASKAYETDEEARYSVSYSFFGDIVKRSLSYTDGDNSGNVAVEKNKNGYKFTSSLDTNGEKAEVTYHIQNTETKLTLDGTVTADGQTHKFSCDYSKKTVAGQTVYVGDTSIEIAGYSLSMKNTLDGDTLSQDITTTIEGVKVSVNIETVYSDKADFGDVDIADAKPLPSDEAFWTEKLEELQTNLYSSPSLAIFFMGQDNQASYDDYYGMDDYDYSDDYSDYYGDYSDDIGNFYGDASEV